MSSKTCRKRGIWYDHEIHWMYHRPFAEAAAKGPRIRHSHDLTTVVSLVFQMLPTALFNTMHMANWLNTGLSTTISWIFAVTFAFFTNKKYVFKSETHTRAAFWREFYMFYGARLVTYFLELAIMELGNHFFATVNGEIVTWRSLLVKILAQVVILVLNYIFSKLVIFKKKETAE